MSLIERRRLDLGDDERPPVSASECHIGDLGARNWNSLDHLPGLSEDRDSTPTVVGNVEVAGLIERHAVWTFPAGKEGKILTSAHGAIRLDRVAQDAIVIGLCQVDSSAVGSERDPIRKGQAVVNLLQTAIWEKAVKP